MGKENSKVIEKGDKVVQNGRSINCANPSTKMSDGNIVYVMAATGILFKSTKIEM